MQHAHDAVDVPRVQADRRLVENEKRVHQRSPEGRGQVDALHLAAAQRARLPVQRQVAESYLDEVAQARTDLTEHEVRGLIQRGGQLQLLEEARAALDGEAENIVDGETGKACVTLGGQPDGIRLETRCGPTHGIRLGERAEPPVEPLGLEPRATAVGADLVGAVLRQQHADMHAIALGLEPVEEALDTVPLALFPLALAFEHPAPLRAPEPAPGHVERHATAAGETHQVVLAFTVALGTPGLYRALAQGQPGIGNDLCGVDALGATEAAASLARSDGRVEGEAVGHGILVMDVAVRTMQIR